jgi:hypothetical protein
MAPKKQPGVPPWIHRTAERLEAFSESRRKTGLPRPPSAPNFVPPLAKWGPSASSDGSCALSEPTNPTGEIQALRLSGAVASSFNPARHTVMVAGRPVVVFLTQNTAAS